MIPSREIADVRGVSNPQALARASSLQPRARASNQQVPAHVSSQQALVHVSSQHVSSQRGWAKGASMSMI